MNGHILVVGETQNLPKSCSKFRKKLLQKIQKVAYANFPLKVRFKHSYAILLQQKYLYKITKISFIENNREDTDDVMFAEGFLMLNGPKIKTSSELPRKSSVIFVNVRKSSKNAQKRSYGLQTTLKQSSEIFGLEIAENTLRVKYQKLPNSCRASLGQPTS